MEAVGHEKDSLVAGLAALVCAENCTSDNLNAVITASGNTVPAYYPTLFASFVEKAGGVDKIYGKGPVAGGAGMCHIPKPFVVYQ